MKELLQEMEIFAVKEHVPIINKRGRLAFIDTVRKAQASRVLEIGTAIGYSTLLLAEHSAPGAHITTLELSAERYQVAADYIARSPYAAQIEQLQGDAGELLVELVARGDRFDFVFIDAAKGQYVDYFHKVQPLLTANATILADNVLFRGYVRSTERPPRRYKTIVKRLREYIMLVTAPPFITEILENGDGLAITKKIRNGEDRC